MIKVAHVVGSLQVGGAERFVIDLCEVQKKNNIHPVIVSLGCPGEALESECHQLNTPVYRYKSPFFIKLAKIFWQLKKCHVIHIHTPHALKFLQWVLPFVDAKIIYTRHGAAPLKASHWLKLHRNKRKYINAITFVSQEGMDNFQQIHGWHKVKAQVIDNGVLVRPVERSVQTDNILRLGSVGRMIPLKNQISLLKAITMLPKELQQEIEVNFFGDGECLPTLEKFVAANECAANVNFHGMVSNREFIYSSFDVLVVTSETEGLSMVIIEAMANKIPVIATNVGGNPKLVIDDKTGAIFEYNDDQRLAELIKHFKQHKQLIEKLGTQAFSYIQDNFSLESTERKYYELYQQ